MIVIVKLRDYATVGIIDTNSDMLVEKKLSVFLSIYPVIWIVTTPLVWTSSEKTAVSRNGFWGAPETGIFVIWLAVLVDTYGVDDDLMVTGAERRVVPAISV